VNKNDQCHTDSSQDQNGFSQEDIVCDNVRLDISICPSVSDKSGPGPVSLTRDARERASDSLNRVGLNLAKRFKSSRNNTTEKGKKRHEPRTSPVVCLSWLGTNKDGDSMTTIDGTELSNVEFWTMGVSQPLSVQLIIHDEVEILLQVEVNPPTVLGVSTFEKFETCIFPNVPIHVQVDTLFATNAIVDWYSDGQQVCHYAPLDIPTSEDANKELVVLITPVRQGHDGQGCQEAYRFKKRVANSTPTNTVLDIRPYWQLERGMEGCGRDLRVMSYNILADQNAFSGPGRSSYFPWCSTDVLERSRRMPLILHEILAYQADVVCLQEVDQIVYETLLEPVLRHYRYQGFHSVKQSLGNQEGCAMFWSLRKFQVVSQEDMRTFRLGHLLAQYKSPLPADQAEWNVCAEAVREMFGMRPSLLDVIENKLGHILQVAHLKRLEDGAPLIVSNTHLFFNPVASHIRVLQLFAIAHQLDKEREEKAAAALANPPFLLCGDFNSSLTYCVLLLMQHHIPKNHRNCRECFNSFRWERNQTDEAVSDLDFPEVNLPKSFPNVATAYPVDTAFTHYIVGFSAAVDHILMTTKTTTTTTTTHGELACVRYAEMPSLEQVTKYVAMPNISFPSDHIAMVADLEWTTSLG